MENILHVPTTNSMGINRKVLFLSIGIQLTLCFFCNADISFLPGTGGGSSYQGVLAYNGSDDVSLHTVCYIDNTTIGRFLANGACRRMGFNGSTRYDSYSISSLNTMGSSLPQVQFECNEDSLSDCRWEAAEQQCNHIVSLECRRETRNCTGRCGSPLNPRLSCQCNSICARFGDCCVDFLKECTRIRLEGTNPLEGVVIVEEKERERDVGYVCHRGKWLAWEASAACADLGYHGNATTYSTDQDAMYILYSYATCEPGDTSLSQCDFTDNATTQEIHVCTLDNEDGCCRGIVGVRCTNQTDDEMTTVNTKETTNTPPTITTTTPTMTNGATITNTNINERKYIYIIIGVVCALLIIIVTFIVIVRSRRRSGKKHPPATKDPTVAMGNLTSDQSADTAPTPFLAQEVLCVEENTYASDPTAPHAGGGVTETNEGEDHEYTYVDVAPVRGQSDDLVQTYMYAEIPQDPSCDPSGVTSGDNDYGLIDNILYGQS